MAPGKNKTVDPAGRGLEDLVFELPTNATESNVRVSSTTSSSSSLLVVELDGEGELEEMNMVPRPSVCVVHVGCSTAPWTVIRC